MYGSGLTVAGRLCRCPCAPGVLVFGGLAARSRIPMPVWAGGGAGTSGGQGCPPAGARVYPGGGGWWVLHTCACSVSVGAAESCGTALSVADAVLFPCAQAPPDRTWEPDHHTRRSPEKPTIPTKTSPHPAEVSVSCVQYRGQPHPLGTSGSLTTNPPQIRTGTRPILNAECGVSGHLRQFECLRCSDCGEVVSGLVGGY